MVEASESIKDLMEYRYLGKTGLKVSVFGYGNWLNSNDTDNYALTRDCIQKMLENGINFYDTAEMYGSGEAERQLGRAFKELNVERKDIVVTTKIFWEGAPSPAMGPNSTGLSR
jgi:aryl-alcohol dehydrogenase-like predicted oxidoreductase